MANDDDTPAGFLSRWSRRKVDERAGRPLDEPKPVEAQLGNLPPNLPISAHPTTAAVDAQPAKPPPTLADTQQLTPDSDFTGFMARGVAPDVKNAAMKKLFADPHFNVMDGLDIYIDDYGIPDPLPLAMLRQMTSAKTLNLFNDEPEELAETRVGDTPAPEDPKVVAQSDLTENTFNPEPTTHDHADLRLQPDPTSGPEGAEPKPV
ncbi:DUF3306 domain-containing protein [Limnohabitans sp.]|uniref:DUF3306 domain-containing protein n=1 Tax=Limnohabitans sp. TaxID=1907725 RepID=UPI00333F9963